MVRALLVVLLVLVCPALALAQDAGAPPSEEHAGGIAAASDGGAPTLEPVDAHGHASTHAAPIKPAIPEADVPTMWIDRNLSKSWELGGLRPFFSAAVDIGYLYVRPRVAVGWGKPFHQWIGLEANPSASANSTGGYAGLRLDLPHFDLRVGARQTYSFNRSYLEPKVAYDRWDLESTARARTFLTILESEANVIIPVGPGAIIALASVSYLPTVPDNTVVYEETLRVMVTPPWVLRQRIGYMFGFGEHKQASIGPAIDVLEVIERRSQVVRAGVLTRFALSRSFELRGTFMPRLFSQDSLGLLESDFTELGLRWRWATASP